MKKILAITAVLLISACSKKSNQEDVPQPPVEDKISFSFGVKEGINTSNFRVGVQIPVDVTEITDTKSGSNFTYVLKPEGKDATLHQVFGEDYVLRVKDGDGFKDVDRFEITSVADLPSFIVEPKVAGTYQLDFTLQRYDVENKKFVGNPVTKRLVFNVVNINFSFPTAQVKKAGWFFGQHSVHKREFQFSIDDGNREYDSYLSNFSSADKYEYITYYDGQTKSGVLEVGTYHHFRDNIETEKGPIPMQNVPQYITIEVVQHLKGGTKNIIKYENVKLLY